MNSVHNMSVDARTQHRPTTERALFSPPHTESSLCWFDRICSVIYVYQWDDSTVEVRVPTSLVTFPFLVWKLLSSSLERIKKCQVKINQIWTYAFVCPLLSFILFDIPSSLSAVINQLFGLCTYHQSTSTHQPVYITISIFSCFVTKYSDPNTEEGLFWPAVGFIWLQGESVKMGKGSYGSGSLRHLVRWRPQSGSERHECSYLLTFFSFFFQSRIPAIHIQDGSSHSHLNKPNRETSSRLSQSFVSQVILDPVNVDGKMLTIVISYLAWFPSKVQHWSTPFLVGIGRHISSIFTKLSLRFID